MSTPAPAHAGAPPAANASTAAAAPTANQLAAAERTRQMLQAPPFPLLVRMASPNALAFFVQAAVSMIEAWYIGRLGTVSLAAIALVFPGLMLMNMLSGGAMGGAVTSAIARSLGAGQPERAQRLVWQAIALALLGGGFFALAWALGGAALLGRLGAAAAVADEARAYGDLVFGGCVLIWLNALLGGVFRGMGDMRFPATLMLVGAAIQVPLSGVLILGAFGAPALGIQGAAASALTVAGVSTLLQLRKLTRHDTALPLRMAHAGLNLPLLRDSLRVGALAALSPVFTVLTIGMVNALVASAGAAALAGYGIGARMEFLLIPLVFGIGASMTSLVGVNVGAGNVARAEHIGWIGGACAATLTGSVGLLLALVPGLWMDVFTSDPAVREAGATYLRVAGPAFAFQGLGLSLYFASQGASAVFWPVVGTIVRFAASVGGAWLALRLGAGLHGMFAGIAVGMVLYGLVTAASLRLGAWRRR